MPRSNDLCIFQASQSPEGYSIPCKTHHYTKFGATVVGRLLRLTDQRAGASYLEYRPTTVHVTVDSYALWNGDIQALGLVVVLGGKGGLQPIVHMEAPRGVGLPQLVELAQVPVRQAHAIGLAVLEGLDFPVVLTAIHAGVTWDRVWKVYSYRCCPHSVKHRVYIAREAVGKS